MSRLNTSSIGQCKQHPGNRGKFQRLGPLKVGKCTAFYEVMKRCSTIRAVMHTANNACSWVGRVFQVNYLPPTCVSCNVAKTEGGASSEVPLSECANLLWAVTRLEGTVSTWTEVEPGVWEDSMSRQWRCSAFPFFPPLCWRVAPAWRPKRSIWGLGRCKECFSGEAKGDSSASS
eukprot:scaffold47534_cov35-Prasinocladus_malaysianus.AAC.1